MTPDQLSQWLLSNDPAPLSTEDRALLARALTELAVAQSLIARQSLLLDSYNTDHATLESTLRAPLARLTTAFAGADQSPFDYAAASKARRDLAGKLAQAATFQDMLALAINAVRAITAR